MKICDECEVGSSLKVKEICEQRVSSNIMKRSCRIAQPFFVFTFFQLDRNSIINKKVIILCNNKTFNIPCDEYTVPRVSERNANKTVKEHSCCS